MKGRLLKLMCIISAVGFFAQVVGCASLFKNKYANLSIDTDPQEADIYIDGNRMGKTPLPIKLTHKKPLTVTLKKEGYEDKTYIINNHVGVGWIVLDVLGGIIPVVVDAVTNNWYTLDDESVKVLLDVKKIPNDEPKTLEAKGTSTHNKERTPPFLPTSIIPVNSQVVKVETTEVDKIDDSLKYTASEFNKRLTSDEGQLQSLYIIEEGPVLFAKWTSEKCYYLRSEVLELAFSLFKTYPRLETIKSINIERICGSDVKSYTISGSELRRFRDQKIDYDQFLNGIE